MERVLGAQRHSRSAGVARGVLAAAVVALVVAIPVSAKPVAKTVNGSILVAGAPAICASQICSVDVTGKNLKALTSAAVLAAASKADCGVGCTAWNGSFSRDGSRIVFTIVANGVGGAQEVWVMDADGTHMRPVTKSASFSTVSQATFSPNGKTIAFTGTPRPTPSNISPEPGIWTINANGTGLHAVTKQVENTFGGSQSAWSPTADKIAFVKFEGMDATGHPNPSGIYLINSNGTGSHRMTPASDQPEQDEAWARTGKWLAFSMLAANWKTTNVATIARINDDGTGLRQLTKPHPQYWDGGPVVSPDGTEIVFYRQHGNAVTGGGRPYIMNADGTNVRPLPFPGRPSSWGIASPK